MPVYYPDFVKQWNNTGGIKYLYGFRRPLAYIDLYNFTFLTFVNPVLKREEEPICMFICIICN